MKRRMVSLLMLCLLVCLTGCQSQSPQAPVPEAAMENPPAMTVSCGGQSVPAILGTSSWRCGPAEAFTLAKMIDCLHVLQSKDHMTALPLSSDDLQGRLVFAAPPTSVTATRWSGEHWDQPDAKGEAVTVTPAEDGSYGLDLQTGGEYIYEVIALWTGDTPYGGTVRYGFYTVSPAVGP